LHRRIVAPSHRIIRIIALFASSHYSHHRIIRIVASSSHNHRIIVASLHHRIASHYSHRITLFASLHYLHHRIIRIVA
jgi:hypothetical protein